MLSALLLVAYILIAGIGIIATTWLVGSMLGAAAGNAPFVPVRNHALEPIIDALEMNDSSVLIDIGCGDGKVLVAAAQRFPNAIMIGIEYGLIPSLLARWRTRSLRNITIVRKNFFACDFSQATHLYTYLFPSIMNRLLPQIERQVRPGTVLVSCDFAFAEKQSLRSIDIALPGSGLAKKLHVYEF